MIKPLVSICCVTYQHVNYIKDAIESFLMQETDFPYEICLGEDESNDGTREICKRYAEKYPDKIRLFLRDRKSVMYINGNPTGRYNLCQTLRECKGKYIALCEGDDYWIDNRKLQKQFNFLEQQSDVVLCASNARVNYEDGTESHLFNVSPRPSIKETTYLSTEDFIAEEIPVHTSTVMFRNGCFDWPSYHTSCNSGDLVLITALSLKGKIAVLPDEMSVYRRNPNSVTNKMAGVADSRSYIALFEGVNKQTNGAYQRKIRRLLSKYYFQDARNNWVIREIKATVTSLFSSMLNSPFNFGYMMSHLILQKLRS